MLGIVIAIAVAVVVLIFIISYNGLVRGRNQVRNSLAQIDVQLKRRADLVPNLVETVKGYAKHEKEVLENITKARASLVKAETVSEKAHASNMLSSTLKSLFAVAENYPKLQANENFLQLQEELSGTESKVAYARQAYNDSVLSYNNSVQSFPRNMLAGMFNFREEQMFTTTEEERKPVKVKF